MQYSKITSHDKENFWDHKILGWENNRYFKKHIHGLVEFIANSLSSSIDKRREFALNELSKKIKGKNVIELGCGSGILGRQLIKECNLSHYTGVDISGKAITKARERCVLHLKDCASFYRHDFNSKITDKDLKKKIEDCDYVISIGFLDWLTEDEIKRVGLVFNHCDHFHSFSEKRRSIKQVIHSKYVHYKYGKNNSGYIPNYYVYTDIKEWLVLSNSCKSYRNKEMSFSTFIFSTD